MFIDDEGMGMLFGFMTMRRGYAFPEFVMSVIEMRMVMLQRVVCMQKLLRIMGRPEPCGHSDADSDQC